MLIIQVVVAKIEGLELCDERCVQEMFQRLVVGDVPAKLQAAEFWKISRVGQMPQDRCPGGVHDGLVVAKRERFQVVVVG